MNLVAFWFGGISILWQTTTPVELVGENPVSLMQQLKNLANSQLVEYCLGLISSPLVVVLVEFYVWEFLQQPLPFSYYDRYSAMSVLTSLSDEVVPALLP